MLCSDGTRMPATPALVLVAVALLGHLGEALVAFEALAAWPPVRWVPHEDAAHNRRIGVIPELS
jgi:hypothetical protein